MFEFQSKEEREAWRVLRELEHIKLWDMWTAKVFDEAAVRFDQREATCGIEPLSKEHFLLGAQNTEDVIDRTPHAKAWLRLKEVNLVKWNNRDEWWDITDKGRAVLANLNAMCKVER